MTRQAVAKDLGQKDSAVAVTAAVPSGRCGIAFSSPTSKPGWNSPAERTVKHRRPMSSEPSAAILNAASSLKAPPERTATRVSNISSSRTPANVVACALEQHAAHERKGGAPGRSRLHAATVAAMGPRRAQTAALLQLARRQWRLYSGKPTLDTEGSGHRIGITLFRSPEF